jgi:acetyltransferase-like isoleucine patch superfamily enzyme
VGDNSKDRQPMIGHLSQEPRGVVARGRLLQKGRQRYGWRSLALGLLYRRKFNRLRALIVKGGWPLPSIDNKGRLEADIVGIWSGARIEVLPGGLLTIGKGTYINRGTSIVCGERVDIGANCMISWDVVIMDTDQHELPGVRSVAPVVIGDGVVIGCRTLILKGVTIGDGAVIGAGSIVTRDISPYTIAVGQPARVVRSLKQLKAQDLTEAPRVPAGLAR